MAQRIHSRGACAFCALETTKAAMTCHFARCTQLQEAVAQAEQGKSASETLLHLRVQDADAKEFWLDLEMRGSATLKKLDLYLRAIWLECCGHLSKFSAGGWGGRDVGMSQAASKAFAVEPQLFHIYDFGTSSETIVSLVGSRVGRALTPHPIALLARNLPPAQDCQNCEHAATHVCMECVYDHEMTGMLCDEHLKAHAHHDYGEPLPLVNSPRLGMCGYDGPALPPY